MKKDIALTKINEKKGSRVRSYVKNLLKYKYFTESKLSKLCDHDLYMLTYRGLGGIIKKELGYKGDVAYEL